MRRLTSRPPGRHPLARLREERGAIAVATALFMPILFGAAAIAIDTAGVWSARQQVETGADAAAIDVAMDCAAGDCGDFKTTAQDAFFANDKAGKVSDLGAGIATISIRGQGGTGTVSVVQTTPWVVNHFFAAALGQGTGELTVASYSAWAPATRATSAVPLAVSWCTYQSLKGSMSSGSATSVPLTTSLSDSCSGPGGSASVAAGTALTAPDGSAACTTTSTWKSNVKTSGSTSLPAGCTSGYLSGLAGSDVLIPVFDAVTGSGSGQTFHVYGYAAFHVTSASASALNGWFTQAAKQVDDTTPPATTAPDLGARSVFLTST